MTPISPGTLLAGRFRLDDLLGETGGARFWRATDLTLMRDVAVLVVDDSDPRAPALLAAARASATVSGPYLLRVLDAAVEDDVTYVVTEWGNGVSLDKLLVEGPLPPRQAAWLVREASHAIAEAHRVGVAHGRLLPENVMVDDSGGVKLIGFVVDGVLHGRPAEVTGEQETDVRNLASLLYAGLTARWPGTPGSTIAEAPRDHDRVLSPRQVRPGVPKALDRLCDNVLNQSDPTFPIRTAHEFRSALSDFLGEVGEGVRVGNHVSDPEATQAIRLTDLVDPEATQAGLPRLYDEDAGPAQPVDDSTKVVSPLTPVSSSRTPYVGVGGGSAPSAWGPDALREPATPAPGWSGRHGTPWLKLAALVAAGLALLVAVVVAFNLGRNGGEPSDQANDGETSAARRPLQLAAVRDFDPFGDPPEENSESIANVHDRNPATTWTTSRYNDGPDITVYKPGVGLLVDLGSKKEVGEVALTLRGSPNAVRLYAVPGDVAPTGIDALDQVAAEPAGGTTTRLRPEAPVATRYLVVWFTGLPAVEGGFRAEVAEIVVRS